MEIRIIVGIEIDILKKEIFKQVIDWKSLAFMLAHLYNKLTTVLSKHFFAKVLTKARIYYKMQTLVHRYWIMEFKYSNKNEGTKFIVKDVFLWTKKRMKLFYLKTKE